MSNQNIQLLTDSSNLDGTDLYIFSGKLHHDQRGAFQENFRYSTILSRSGTDFKPVQNNIVNSVKNVFRGIHKSNLQNKFITCVFGEIVDFAVDLRTDSRNFGKQYAINLNAMAPMSVLIPKGFGHAYFVKSSFAVVSYLVDHEFMPDEEEIYHGGELVSGLDLCPVDDLILSEKDSAAPRLKV
jgi:dTDP-4-dehydrorhamnose 3,5-epimerase